jgi:uncharacterized membrane protein YkvI
MLAKLLNEVLLIVVCTFVLFILAMAVFQRRQDGTVDFTRNWQEYKDGFEYVNNEHWLGMVTYYVIIVLFIYSFVYLATSVKLVFVVYELTM